MATPVQVGFEANGEQSVTHAWDAIKKGIEDNVRALARIPPEAKAAEEAEKALGKAAEKWLKDIQTPQERYHKKLAELDQLLKAGKLSQDQYKRAVAQTANELKNAGQASEGFFSSGIGKVGAMAAGLLSVQTLISGIANEQARWNEGIERTAEMLADQELKLQIQGGFTPAEVEGQMEAIKKAVQATPVVDLNRAIQIQTQAASSGFKQEDVNSGAALQATLDVMAATNQFGQGAADPKQSMQAISMYLKGSSGELPDAAAIREAGGKLATIFKESDVQFSDLEQLSKQAATLTGSGLTQAEQFSAFSALRDVFGAEKGAMGLKGYTVRSATIGSDQKKTGALAQLGLKPEDVDIAKGGDQLIPTLEKMAAALKTKTAEQQIQILNTLYGEEVQSQAAFLLRDDTIQKIKDRVAAQEGSTLLDDNLTKFRGSRFARNQRVANAQAITEREVDQQRGGTTYKELNAENQAYIDQLYAEGKISSVGRAAASFTEGWTQYGRQAIGLAPADINKLRAERLQDVDQNSAYAKGIQADQAAKQPLVVNVNIKRPTNENPKPRPSAAVVTGRQ